MQLEGTPIDPLDMMIAAHAKALAYTVVTNNTKEFERVKGLKLKMKHEIFCENVYKY